MKALVFSSTLYINTDVPIPRIPGEALLRVRMAGICSTDIELTHGYKSFSGVLGHEFVGQVLESPNPAWIGKRVCGEINTRCGECRYCLAGMRTHCAQRTVLGILNRSGTFAKYCSLPLENLHTIPDDLPDDEAVYVEPLAAAFQILEQVHVSRSDQVVVLGDGKLGLLCAQVLARHSDHVTLVGRHPGKLELGTRWGVDTQLSTDALPLDADVVVEATGSEEGIDMALEMVRPRGVIVLKSTTARNSQVDLSRAVVKEITIVGSRCGPFTRAIEALVRREVTVTSLTEATYSLDEGVEAVAHASRTGALKVLMRML